jgi:hypothetical protein
MSESAHLVSAGRSHPCVPAVAQGATRHVVVAGRCAQCGSTVNAGAPRILARARGGWRGARVLAGAIGSGALVLGTAYLLLATERMRLTGGAPLSAPAVVGAACLVAGSILVRRAIRG